MTLCRDLAARVEVDLIDCSSGGILPDVRIPPHPGYQVPFACGATRGSPLARPASSPNERADPVFVARVLLADPGWPLQAAKALGMKPSCRHLTGAQRSPEPATTIPCEAANAATIAGQHASRFTRRLS